MTLNARKSCADSFLKIKTNANRARFSKNPRNIEKFDNETLKLQPVNLSEKRRDIVGVHQRAADSLQRLWKYQVNSRGSPPRDRVGDLPVFCARGVGHLPFIFSRG